MKPWKIARGERCGLFLFGNNFNSNSFIGAFSLTLYPKCYKLVVGGRKINNLIKSKYGYGQYIKTIGTYQSVVNQ